MSAPTSDQIADALDVLLGAMIANREHRHRTMSSGPIKIHAFAASKPVPTRRQSELAALARDPIEASYRMAVRRLGEALFEITGSVGGMADVATHVVGRDPAHEGRRASILDHAWDGIGSERDRWFA